MSLLITDLAFADEGLVAAAKLGILLTSLEAGVLGYFVLRRALPAGVVQRAKPRKDPAA